MLPRATGISNVSRSALARSRAGGGPARILLVEDDAEVAQVTMELLQDIGLQVIRARD